MADDLPNLQLTPIAGELSVKSISEEMLRGPNISEIRLKLTDGTEATIPCSSVELGWGDPEPKILAAAVHHLIQRVERLEVTLGEAQSKEAP